MAARLLAGTRRHPRAGGFVPGGRPSPLFARGLLVAALALCSAHCAGPARKPALHRIVIRRFSYQPAALEIAAGDTVEWVNDDIVPHTSTARSGAWDSKSISPEGSWRTVPARKGTEPYGCLFHPSMKALLVVR